LSESFTILSTLQLMAVCIYFGDYQSFFNTNL